MKYSENPMQLFAGPEAANDNVTPVPGREPLQLSHLAAGETPKEEPSRYLIHPWQATTYPLSGSDATPAPPPSSQEKGPHCQWVPKPQSQEAKAHQKERTQNLWPNQYWKEGRYSEP